MQESSPTSSPFVVRPVSPAPDVAPQSSQSEADPVKGQIARISEHLPVEMYEEKYGHPLLVDVLDLKSVFGKSGFEPQIADINRYILSEITSQGLESNRSSYESVLRKLESQLEIDPNLRYDLRLEKLGVMARVFNQERMFKQLKESLRGQ